MYVVCGVDRQFAALRPAPRDECVPRFDRLLHGPRALSGGAIDDVKHSQPPLQALTLH